MNTKAEQAKGMGPADIGKLALASIVLIAGIVGFYYFSDNPNVPSFARVIGVIAAVAAALAIGAFTAPGRKLRGFIAEPVLRDQARVRARRARGHGIIVL